MERLAEIRMEENKEKSVCSHYNLTGAIAEVLRLF